MLLKNSFRNRTDYNNLSSAGVPPRRALLLATLVGVVVGVIVILTLYLNQDRFLHLDSVKSLSTIDSFLSRFRTNVIKAPDPKSFHNNLTSVAVDTFSNLIRAEETRKFNYSTLNGAARTKRRKMKNERNRKLFARGFESPTMSDFLILKKKLKSDSRLDIPGLDGYLSIPQGKPLSLKCSSCALVTNSGHLIESGVGADIDATDCVFRLNHAPTLSHTSDVGSKTTVRLVGHPSWSKIKNDRITLLVGPQRPRHVIVWGPFILKSRQSIESDMIDFVKKHNYTDIKFYYMNYKQLETNAAVFEKETGLPLKRETTGVYMSTGYTALLLTMAICKNITIYGIPDENQCRQLSDRNSVRNESSSRSSSKQAMKEKIMPYHYWEPYGTTECQHYLGCQYSGNGHRFFHEKLMFRRWAKVSKKVRFRSPEWDLDKEVRLDFNSPTERRKMGKFGSCWG